MVDVPLRTDGPPLAHIAGADVAVEVQIVAPLTVSQIGTDPSQWAEDTTGPDLPCHDANACTGGRSAEPGHIP